MTACITGHDSLSIRMLLPRTDQWQCQLRFYKTFCCSHHICSIVMKDHHWWQDLSMALVKSWHKPSLDVSNHASSIKSMSLNYHLTSFIQKWPSLGGHTFRKKSDNCLPISFQTQSCHGASNTVWPFYHNHDFTLKIMIVKIKMAFYWTPRNQTHSLCILRLGKWLLLFNDGTGEQWKMLTIFHVAYITVSFYNSVGDSFMRLTFWNIFLI